MSLSCWLFILLRNSHPHASPARIKETENPGLRCRLGEGKGSLCKSLSQTAGTWNINRHYWGKKRIKLRTIKKPVASKCQFDVSLVVSVSSIFPTHPKLADFSFPLPCTTDSSNMEPLGLFCAVRSSTSVQNIRKTRVQPVFSTEGRRFER